MKFNRVCAIALLGAAVALPLGVQASSTYHPSRGELTGEYFADHAFTSKSRAEVTAELERLKREGNLQRMQLGLGYPMPNPGKTRDEVRAEMQNMTAAERARLRSMGGGYPL